MSGVTQVGAKIMLHLYMLVQTFGYFLGYLVTAFLILSIQSNQSQLVP